jgi:hypothetical protein
MRTLLSSIKILCIFFICMAGGNVWAQNNPKISIQGTLKDATGAAVADGNYSVNFKLYDAATGGTVKWQETATVGAVGGIYSHKLGSVTALNPGIFNSQLYLALTVQGFELTPRTELTYTAYAMAVEYVTCSGAVGDVKYSILNPTQFAAQNGDCWVPMDGRNIQGSILHSVAGMNNAPDASGAFFRSQEFNGGANRDPDRTSSSPIATIQNHALNAHNHTMNSGGAHTHTVNSGGAHTHTYTDIFLMENGNFWDGLKIDPGTTSGNGDVDNDNIGWARTHVTQSAGAHTHTLTESGAHTHTINNNGGSETRPVNMNLWAYIRIN